MVDPLAVYGALTGTVGLGIGVRREVLASRRRLVVEAGSNFTLSRTDPARVALAWWIVAVRNPGGRALAVERIGMECVAGGEPRVAEVNLDEPIELPVDGPQRKVYTPLGPILAAGVVPFSTVRPFAVTTGGKWWYAEPRPLVMLVPPGVVPEHFAENLGKLMEASEPAPLHGQMMFLAPDQPRLIEPDFAE